MNIWTISIALFIAFGFVGWPIVGSYSRVCGGWVGTVVLTSTAITVAMFSFRQLNSIPVPNTKAMILLLVAGIINGLAVYLYSSKITDTNVPAAVFVVMVSILMVVVAPLLNWLLNDAVPNFQQTLGFGFAIVAIYFLSK